MMCFGVGETLEDGVAAGFGLRLNAADVVAVGEEEQLSVKSC